MTNFRFFSCFKNKFPLYKIYQALKLLKILIEYLKSFLSEASNFIKTFLVNLSTMLFDWSKNTGFSLKFIIFVTWSSLLIIFTVFDITSFESRKFFLSSSALLNILLPVYNRPFLIKNRYFIINYWIILVIFPQCRIIYVQCIFIKTKCLFILLYYFI